MAKKRTYKLSKKAAKLLRKDVLLSVAATSLLLNIFFIAGLVTYASTNRLDENFYDVAYSNYCVENYNENLVNYMKDSSDPQLTRLKFEAFCRRDSFTPYYQNALEAFISDNQNQ